MASWPFSRNASPPIVELGGESVRSEIGDIRAIEGLRGVAVLWVLLFHYVTLRSVGFGDVVVAWVDASPPLHLLVRNGYLGVDLFFLITGFLLTLPWFRHASLGRASPSMRLFYWRRVRRIVPAYYVQLVVLFFICAPLLIPGLWRGARDFMLGNLALHALFLQQLTPYSSASLSINGALWTLTLEAQYYVLLPLLAVCFVRAPNVAAVAMFAVAVLWKALSAHDLQPLIAFYAHIGARWHIPEADLRHLAATQLPAYLGHFALGILSGRAWLANRDAAPTRAASAMLGLLAGVAIATLYLALNGSAAAMGEQAWVLFPLSMALFMWAAVSCRPRWGTTVLGFRGLAFVGRVSYSMYLYHLPLLLLLNKYAGSALGGLTFPFYLAVVILVGTLSFRYVEQPFMGAPDARRSSRSAIDRG